MRKGNESAEIEPKKVREEMHRDKKRKAERECVWLWDYSYRAADELMRCVIRQI